MKNADIFDVLVVYSERVAESASRSAYKGLTPFRLDSAESCYNVSYGYFLKRCAKQNISAAFATSKDIVGPGLVKSYWVFENNNWKRVIRVAYSRSIFDKFFPVTRVQKINHDILFSRRSIQSFSDRYLRTIFSDKQNTYNFFSDVSIPTVTLSGNTKESITEAVLSIRRLIEEHPNRVDFLNDLVMKDQFGSGGNHIYRIQNSDTRQISKIMRSNDKIHFVLQPFAKFDHGYEYKGTRNYTDIRLIYYGKKIVQIYIRVAVGKEFRCNVHQGASVAYLQKNELPQSILKTSLKIIRELGRKSAFYALDFIVCNSKNVYLLEGNINPGIYWEYGEKEDEKWTKKLIDSMVFELGIRARSELHQRDILPEESSLSVGRQANLS